MAPTASAAENTTPITVSVAMRVRDSTAQTSSVPSSSAPRPPSTGFTPASSASAMPGNATCEIASEASVILRMTAKQPTSPAAIAMPIDSASAPSSMLTGERGTSWGHRTSASSRAGVRASLGGPSQARPRPRHSTVVAYRYTRLSSCEMSSSVRPPSRFTRSIVS